MAKKDYYETLGVQRSATPDELKQAFRRLALKYHPDKNPGDSSAEERFKDLNEAYAVLSDPEKRKQYDSFGADGFRQRFSQEDIFRDFDLSSIFGDMGGGQAGFGGDIFSTLFGGRGRRRSARGRNPFGNADFGSFDGGAGPFGGADPRSTRGQDFQQVMEISFNEAVLGGQRRVSLSTPSGGREDLTVRIPPGVTDGKRLRLAGKGGPAMGPGGDPGDLFLEIRVASHPTFRRDGRDLIVEQTISLTQAVLGGQVTVPTLSGETKQLRVPAGSQGDTRLRMRGLGVPAHNGTPAGDQYVVLKVKLPRKLSQEQRELFEKLQATGC
jgi:curved DNA-binding protein